MKTINYDDFQLSWISLAQQMHDAYANKGCTCASLIESRTAILFSIESRYVTNCPLSCSMLGPALGEQV